MLNLSSEYTCDYLDILYVFLISETFNFYFISQIIFKVIFGHLSYQIMVVGPLVVGLFILGTKQNLLPSEIISWNYLLPSWTHQPIRGQPGQCPPLWLLVQFSHSVMSDPLWPHGLQHARPPCPSPTCPLSRWCHPTISSSVVPFSSCLQSLLASRSFQMSQFFASGGQGIGVSASALVLPVNIQDRFPLGLTGWISLLSKGFSRVFSNTTVQKHQFFGTQLSL